MGCKDESISKIPGHMSKMAAMPIYGKNPLKIFFSKTGKLMTFILGIQHQMMIQTTLEQP